MLTRSPTVLYGYVIAYLFRAISYSMSLTLFRHGFASCMNKQSQCLPKISTKAIFETLAIQIMEKY